MIRKLLRRWLMIEALENNCEEIGDRLIEDQKNLLLVQADLEDYIKKLKKQNDVLAQMILKMAYRLSCVVYDETKKELESVGMDADPPPF